MAPPRERSRRSRWLVVASLLALAAVVRVSAMFYENISGDDATVALMAKHILSGENFPVFFYRQTFIGSLNGAHLVPALFLFGPSVPFAPLNAIAWSLLFPLLLYVLGRRLFDETTARVTLLLTAVPPFCLTYWSSILGHFETNIFGTILILLILPVLTGCSEARRTRLLGCLGFVAGIAFWSSAKVVVVLGPILLLLLVRDPLLPVRRGGLLFGGGFVVGSSPAWLFYLTQQDPGQGNLGSARRFLEVGLDFSWAWLSRYIIEVPPLIIGTYYWDPDTPVRMAVLAVCLGIYAAAVVVMVIATIRSPRDGVPAARVWGVWLLLLTLVATYAVLYVSEFSRVGEHARARYVLPAYIPFLLFLGAAIVWLSRRSRVAAAAVLVFVLAFNVWTNFAFLWPLHPDERAKRGAGIARREAFVHHLEAHPVEVMLTDNPYDSLIWQFLLPRPVVSAMATEIYYPSSVRADASPHVAVLAQHDQRIGPELLALGAIPTVTRFGEWQLFEDVRMPDRAYRLTSRAGWRALGEPGVPTTLADGDLGTYWPPRRLERSEAGPLVLDMGTTRSVARIVFWPNASTDVMVPLEVAGSLDAVTWKRLGVAPPDVGRPALIVGQRPVFRPRNGWLEVVTTPVSIRYLRVQVLEPDTVGAGMVGELFAYEAVERPGGSQSGMDLGALLHALRSHGVTRLLADPVVSARVALAMRGAVATLPANGALNSHGLAPPPYLYAHFRLRDTDAVVVSEEDAGELEERLRAAGVRVTTEALGPYVLVQPVGPLVTAPRCRAIDWRVTAESPDADGKGARYVVEGRWPTSMRVGTVRLEHPRVSTRNAAILAIGLAEDGGAWRGVTEPRPVPEWAWAGRTLFTFSSGVTELAVGGLPGRAVRVEVHLPYRGAGAITSLCVREQA